METSYDVVSFVLSFLGGEYPTWSLHDALHPSIVLSGTKLPPGISGQNSKFCRISVIHSRIQPDFWIFCQFRSPISAEWRSATSNRTGHGQNLAQIRAAFSPPPFWLSGKREGSTITPHVPVRLICGRLEMWWRECCGDQRHFRLWHGPVWECFTSLWKTLSGTDDANLLHTSGFL